MAVTAVAPSEVGVKVGDFFVSSWGYDQTNVDFYKVVGLTPKGVKVQKWQSKHLETSHPAHDSVVPGDGPATWVDWSACTEGMDYWERQEAKVTRPVPVKTKRLHAGYRQGQPSFTVNSFSSAYKWDGKPEYQTGAGYGH